MSLPNFATTAVLLCACIWSLASAENSSEQIVLEFENASPETRLSIGLYADDYDCSGFRPVASISKTSSKRWNTARKPYQTVSLQYTGILPHSREDSIKFSSCTVTMTFRADDAPAYRVSAGAGSALCQINVAKRESGPDGERWTPIQASLRTLVASLPSPPAPWCIADAAFRN